MRTLLLTLTTCLLVLPVQAKYSGGTGEPNDPYQIATAADLIALGETPEDYDKHFILTADIDLDPNLPGRKVFDKAVIAPDTDPVKGGFPGTPFTGVFDGKDHTISHLTIKGADFVGLFGRLEYGADVKNLGLVDLSISGSGQAVAGLVGWNEGSVTECYSTGAVSGGTEVGGLVGWNWGSVSYCHSTDTVSGDVELGGLVGGNGGVVTQCYSTGVVSGKDCVGGLVGTMSEGFMTQCYSTGAVTGSTRVGGLVGFNSEGTVTECFSTGTVSGTGNSVGGLVGCNGGPSEVRRCYSTGAVKGGEDVGGLVGFNGRGPWGWGSVIQCYSTGAVTGTSSVGGLMGFNGGGPWSWGSVIQCYSTGAVTGTSSVGGLVGTNEGVLTGCFWDTQTSGQAKSAAGVGKTTAQMQTAKTFLDAGWDFVGETVNGSEDIWKIAEGLGYPRLSWEKYSGGTGEPNDPYQIATAADLIALGETPADYDKHFLLTADIDLDPKLPGRKVFDRAVIAPTWETPFTGIFDGNGHSILHLTIVGGECLGVFGILSGEVKDLGVADVNVTGSGGYVGALAATNEGSVTGCFSSGSVTAAGWVVGGLVGYSDSGTVTECYSTSSVSGVSEVGGLVGGNGGGTVTECYSTGRVSGTSFVGGLVGSSGGPGAVMQCYSTSTVSGKDYVGGLVGSNCSGSGYWGGRPDVSECYSTGRVSGTSFVGGLVGSNTCLWSDGVQGTDTACFWDAQTSGQPKSAGGIGKTTAEMQRASTFLQAGWDFVGETANGKEDLWWILEGKDYPRLGWEARNR